MARLMSRAAKWPLRPHQRGQHLGQAAGAAARLQHPVPRGQLGRGQQALQLGAFGFAVLGGGPAGFHLGVEKFGLIAVHCFPPVRKGGLPPKGP